MDLGSDDAAADEPFQRIADGLSRSYDAASWTSMHDHDHGEALRKGAYPHRTAEECVPASAVRTCAPLSGRYMLNLTAVRMAYNSVNLGNSGFDERNPSVALDNAFDWESLVLRASDASLAGTVDILLPQFPCGTIDAQKALERLQSAYVVEKGLYLRYLKTYLCARDLLILSEGCNKDVKSLPAATCSRNEDWCWHFYGSVAAVLPGLSCTLGIAGVPVLRVLQRQCLAFSTRERVAFDESSALEEGSAVVFPQRESAGAQEAPKEDTGSTTPIILGSLFGTLALLGLIGFLVLWIRWRRRNNTMPAAFRGLPRGALTRKFRSTVNSTSTTASTNLVNSEKEAPSGLYKVVRKYTAQLKDELDLRKDDIVEVEYLYDDGWCRGLNLTTRASGMFPLAVVKPLTEA
ncbi:hypothetical protein HDU96_009802 [Phlyctochytrium bullatum]|nr:hypothetical protein HDU96_009802 [Phlyctochytrium bullatum]